MNTQARARNAQRAYQHKDTKISQESLVNQVKWTIHLYFNGTDFRSVIHFITVPAANAHKHTATPVATLYIQQNIILRIHISLCCGCSFLFISHFSSYNLFRSIILILHQSAGYYLWRFHHLVGAGLVFCTEKLIAVYILFLYSNHINYVYKRFPKSVREREIRKKTKHTGKKSCD